MNAVVVGAAIVDAGRVLAVQRGAPPQLAGQWEFPGGKVEPGETEIEALVRECREELGLDLAVGERVGPDVPILDRFVLRVYAARIVAGTLHLTEHTDARWLSAEDIWSVPWIAADAPIVTAVAASLRILG